MLSFWSLIAFRSCATSLQNCKPVHKWSSNNRCFAQNFPRQWPQSPTIRRGLEEHPPNEHLFFFVFFLGTMVVGAKCGEGIGVEAASLMTISVSDPSLGMLNESRCLLVGASFVPL